MGYGVVRSFQVTMASAGTLTAQVDLANAGSLGTYLEIPTMTSNSQVHIQAAIADSGTFRRIYHPTLNSSTVGTNVFAIVSGATNCVVPIPNGLRYMKIETTATIDNGCLFRIICLD